MKETEKRMKYYNLSKNIIACDNFLPEPTVNEIYTDLLNNRHLFQVSNWNSKEDSLNCGGMDFWITNKNKLKIKSIRQDIYNNTNSYIEKLSNWFFHQGLRYYANNNGPQLYEFLSERKLSWKIHVVTYNNQGYYNWHKDEMNNVLFTFNLILHKSDKLKGGHMRFMEDDKIIEVKNKNNFMTLFPSYIPHCISPIYTDDNKDVAFLDQRFSIQFWVSLKP
jgi:hypothetical protein|tara:strand:- start:191 stop:853 length:663 start_codon:yes stop_codon:yes gene_type:complete